LCLELILMAVTINKLSQKKFSVKRSKAGLGLYASVFLKKGDFLIEYLGEIITNEEADRRSNRYIFKLTSRLAIDGSGRKNLGRYINHSCQPNCEAYQEGRQIKIYAMKNIKPGEELTYDYGKEYFDEYIKPKGCRCEKCRSSR
jgi:uncharacterized protein